MSTDITVDQLTAKVRELAAERPNFADVAFNEDGECVYLYDGKPSCLFGHAFVALGLDADALADLDRLGTGIGKALRDLDIKHTVDQRDWCIEVQTEQDAGIPWGKAVAEADAYIEGLR